MSDSGKVDQVKGHAKEAIGDLTDDQHIKREGALDRAAGSAKEAVHDLKDKADAVVDRAKDTLRRENDER